MRHATITLEWPCLNLGQPRYRIAETTYPIITRPGRECFWRYEKTLYKRKIFDPVLDRRNDNSTEICKLNANLPDDIYWQNDLDEEAYVLIAFLPKKKNTWSIIPKGELDSRRLWKTTEWYLNGTLLMTEKRLNNIFHPWRGDIGKASIHTEDESLFEVMLAMFVGLAFSD